MARTADRGSRRFTLDIANEKHEEAVRKLIQDLNGSIVDTIELRFLPVAVISDGTYAAHLEKCSHDEKMKVYRLLPIVLKDAVHYRVPVITVESFKNNVQKRRENEKMPAKETPPRQDARKRAPVVVLSSGSDEVGEGEPKLVRLGSSHVVVRDGNEDFGLLFKKVKRPVIHIGVHFGASLFHEATPSVVNKRMKDLDKEENDMCSYQNVQSGRFQPYGPPKPAKIQSGFCEMCHHSTQDFAKHFTSIEHQRKCNEPGIYDRLDEILKDYNSPIFDPTRRINNNELISDKVPMAVGTGGWPYSPEKTFKNDFDIFDNFVEDVNGLPRSVKIRRVASDNRAGQMQRNERRG